MSWLVHTEYTWIQALSMNERMSMVFWPKDICFECLLHQITLICTPKGLCLKVWNTSIVQIKKMIELTNSRKTIYGLFNSIITLFFSVFTDTRTWFCIHVQTLDASIQNVRENKNGGLQNCSIDKLHIKNPSFCFWIPYRL